MSDMNSTGRMVVWFSCGAASAVAAKVCVDAYGPKREVVVVNVDMSADEHEDNERFLKDVERWIDRPIERIKNEKYPGGIFNVFLKERFIVSKTQGAACSRRLKREVQWKYAKPGDTKVVGYTADRKELVRAVALRQNFPEENFFFVLAEHRIFKSDCFKVLTTAGIKLPVMYELGFTNNNCRGCVKGGIGHWNKVRKHFPDRFWEMARIQRILNYPFHDGVFLDELDPEAGRDDEPDIECGLFCGDYTNLVPLTVKKIAS